MQSNFEMLLKIAQHFRTIKRVIDLPKLSPILVAKRKITFELFDTRFNLMHNTFFFSFRTLKNSLARTFC